jgi:hypothetical protein
VKVGLIDRSSAQVISGLAAGDRVVLETPAGGSDQGNGRGGAPLGMGFRL